MPGQSGNPIDSQYSGAPSATVSVSRLLIVRCLRSVTITQSSAIANPASNT